MNVLFILNNQYLFFTIRNYFVHGNITSAYFIQIELNI